MIRHPNDRHVTPDQLEAIFKAILMLLRDGWTPKQILKLFEDRVYLVERIGAPDRIGAPFTPKED